MTGLPEPEAGSGTRGKEVTKVESSIEKADRQGQEGRRRPGRQHLASPSRRRDEEGRAQGQAGDAKVTLAEKVREVAHSRRRAEPSLRQEDPMSFETLRYERDGHVVVLTYDRPEQRNAVSRRMNTELHEAWRRFRDDDEAFVLVMTGAGDAFCAGWDLADAAETTRGGDMDQFRTHLYNSPGDCGYTRRVDVFKPVIAAMNGWAVAAGLEKALLADIRIVAEGAVFGALERRWNIVAGDGMTVRLPIASATRRRWR